MELLWLILPVVLVCVEAENQTEVKVGLGQNIILNCSVDAQVMYWYMEIHSQFRGCIVIARNTSSDDQYFVSIGRTKYVAIRGNKLLIMNVTAEDRRLYFCARRQNDHISFVDAFRIVSDVPVAPSNNSEARQQHIWRTWQSEPVVYTSFGLNVLLLVVICLVCTCLCLKRRNSNRLMNESSASTYENTEMLETPQYEEIQLPTYRASRPAAPPPECIYSKAQLPQPTLPRQ